MMRRGASVVALLAIVCLGLGIVLPATAGADRAGKVQLSVDGAGFTSTPVGPLFDTSALSPGSTRSADLGVRSAFGVATKLWVGLFDVHDDDNGCTASEAGVDRTCGVGQGDLASALVIRIDLATKRTGRYRTVWTGTAERLARTVAIDAAVPAKSERWLRMTAAVPASVGNVVQTDTISFGVRVVLSGNGAHGGFDIGGVHTNTPGSHDASGHGIDGLAATGASLVLLIVGALALLVAGTMLTVAGLSQRRNRSKTG